MKFKGQGKINICGFEYKKNIADSRRGGGSEHPKKTVSAPGRPTLMLTLIRFHSNYLFLTLLSLTAVT